MKRKIKTILVILLNMFFLTSGIITVAQNSLTTKGKGDLAENLWFGTEAQWESDMLQILEIGEANKADLQQFLDYNQSEFYKDRGEFFSGVSQGYISENNAVQFFENIKDKYVSLYNKFLQIKTAYPDSVKNYIQASNILPPPSFQSTCNPSCNNIGFQNGTLSAWDAYYGVDGSTSGTIIVNALTGGTCGSVTQAGGPDPNTGNNYQVSLINNPGTDPIAGALIPNTPPLGGICARVGDGPINGFGVGKLQQTYLADASNPILTLQYAVVLENPGHSGFVQPWFHIQVLDQNNNPIPGCGQYFEVASAGLAGFKGIYYPQNGDTVYCRPWATVFVPLYNYIGQCITVIYEASDCAFGGHFGYGYVAASCTKLNLISSSPVFCNGQQSATITAPPGAASYQWTTPDGCISGSSTTQVLNVSCGGTYNVVTTSSGSATCVDTFSITIPASPAGPQPKPCFSANTVCSGNPTQFNASCSNPNGGGAKFYWDFYNNGQYEDSSGINPTWTYSKGGLYQVRLHEVSSNGCGSDTVITIAVDSTENSTFPVFTVTPTDATSCSACNGKVSLHGSGFQSAITYTITTNFCTGATTIKGGSVSHALGCGGCSKSVSVGGGVTIGINGCLCPGTYYFYIKPDLSTPPTLCNPGIILADTIPFTISATGVSITANVVSAPASCGNNNGSATVTAFGGTAPYTYTWSSGLGTGVAKTGLAAGTYTVSIQDSSGCKGSTTVNILLSGQQPAIITPYYASCFGANNGSIKITPTGGASPYTYNWTGNISTTDSAGGLAPGTYSVTVTDAGGCSGTFAATIIQPAQLRDSIVSSVTNISCGGAGKGSATFGVKGGSPPYRFAWSDGNTKATDTALAVGTTTVTITDANGCTVIDSVTVTATGSFVVNAGPDLTICRNDSTQINVTGIPGGSTISWSPSTGLSCSNCSNPVAKPTVSTTYILSVNDSSCTSTDTLRINVTSSVTASVIPIDTTTCANAFFQLHASGGSNYLWKPSSGLSDSASADPLVYTTVTTTYTVTVSTPGCSSATATATINVYPVPPTPIITQVHGDTLICSIDSSYALYQWYDSTSVIPGATDTFLVITKSGNYNIRVTDKNGCVIAVGTNVIIGSNGILKNSISSIRLFPNPAQGELIVSSNLLQGNIIIFNMLGELIQEEKIKQSGKTIINVSNLAAGIYIIQLSNESNRFVRRFVKE